jgi:SPP1 family predicted phage head-tail adaptor
MTWRSRGFRLGSMRERITVQTATETLDAAGQSIRSWTSTLTGEPAAYEPVSGGETIRGRQVEAGVTAIFTVRFRTGYTSTQRVTHGSGTYGILYVHPVEGGRRFIDLHCKATP